MKVWLDISLYSINRGINRFKGLAMALVEMEKRGHHFDGLEEFITWTEESAELSNPALLAYAQKCNSDCVEKALLWSIRTNRAIHQLTIEDKPFANVKTAMEEMSKRADLVSLSSSNFEAIDAEWTKHGLKENCRAILCQEVGSTSYCIQQMVKRKGYAPDRILMVGDAPTDRDAAVENGAWYYPILVGKESESWERLLNEAFPKFMEGTFNQEYQDTLMKEFELNLGV